VVTSDFYVGNFAIKLEMARVIL